MLLSICIRLPSSPSVHNYIHNSHWGAPSMTWRLGAGGERGGAYRDTALSNASSPTASSAPRSREGSWAQDRSMARQTPTTAPDRARTAGWSGASPVRWAPLWSSGESVRRTEVPPVGLEPTLVTLLGGLPLPLGYEGVPIIPAGPIAHFDSAWPDGDTKRPASKGNRSYRVDLSGTVGGAPRGQLTRRRRPSSTWGWLASAKAWRGSAISGSAAKSRRRKKESVQSERTRSLRLKVGTASRW